MLQTHKIKIIHKNKCLQLFLNLRLPLVWASSIITRARKEGRIRDDFAVKTIIDELNKFRGQCGLLISYDTISVPLVYTQVIHFIFFISF